LIERLYFDEGCDSCSQFGAVAVGAAVDDLFLHDAVEPLDNAVGFWLSNECEAGGEPMEATLTLEVGGEVLTSVVVPKMRRTACEIGS